MVGLNGAAWWAANGRVWVRMDSGACGWVWVAIFERSSGRYMVWKGGGIVRRGKEGGRIGYIPC